jgi:alkylation response protein AidB-like acyl-CoA dehydrogenase
VPSLSPEHRQQLERICREVVAPSAQRVDASGEFPAAAVKELARAGLLGAASSTEAGGLGLGPRGCAEIVRALARECGSTAMVVTMHFCGATVLEAHAPMDVRREAAAGRHLSTLAFSEAGSRSHFWAPVSTATRDGSSIRLDARKSWITSASHATAYVWSSRPVEAEGLSTIWLVPRESEGLSIAGGFDGLGLRGNDSAPAVAEGVRVPQSARLGEDGGGFGVQIGTVLPLFNVCETAVSCGLMDGGVERTIAHVTSARYEHSGTTLADLPTLRAGVARMKVKADLASALLEDTLAALETGREDATLRVLECKAASAQLANEALDLGMRACGGQAFRKDVGIERHFRDARAAGVMAPTTDVLLDFIGKAACGMPLF